MHHPNREGCPAVQEYIRGQLVPTGATGEVLRMQSHPPGMLDKAAPCHGPGKNGDTMQSEHLQVYISAFCTAEEKLPQAGGQSRLVAENLDGHGFKSPQSRRASNMSFLGTGDSSVQHLDSTSARASAQRGCDAAGASERFGPSQQQTAQGSAVGTASSTSHVQQWSRGIEPMPEDHANADLQRKDRDWCAQPNRGQLAGEKSKQVDREDAGENGSTPAQVRYLGQLKQQLWNTASLYLQALTEVRQVIYTFFKYPHTVQFIAVLVPTCVSTGGLLTCMLPTIFPPLQMICCRSSRHCSQ